MDIISIFGAVWRHKFVTIPVILLVLLGAVYIVKVKAPVYSSSASVLLATPPAAPTSAQIAANPKLKKISANNPYENLGGLPVVADAVISVVTSPTSETALVKAGADPRYQTQLSSAFGTPPIIQITGVGSTPQEAILSAKLVTQATMTDLYDMQKAQGVNPFYMVKSIELVPPSAPTASVSSKLRTLIALLALGAIMLFLVVSVMDVFDRRRKAADAPDNDVLPSVRPRSRTTRQLGTRRYDSDPAEAPRAIGSRSGSRAQRS